MRLVLGPESLVPTNRPEEPIFTRRGKPLRSSNPPAFFVSVDENGRDTEFVAQKKIFRPTPVLQNHRCMKEVFPCFQFSGSVHLHHSLLPLAISWPHDTPVDRVPLAIGLIFGVYSLQLRIHRWLGGDVCSSARHTQNQNYHPPGKREAFHRVGELTGQRSGRSSHCRCPFVMTALLISSTSIAPALPNANPRPHWATAGRVQAVVGCSGLLFLQ